MENTYRMLYNGQEFIAPAESVDDFREIMANLCKIEWDSKLEQELAVTLVSTKDLKVLPFENRPMYYLGAIDNLVYMETDRQVYKDILANIKNRFDYRVLDNTISFTMDIDCVDQDKKIEIRIYANFITVKIF